MTDEYNKQDLTIHKDGTAALISAIIKQWHDDGEPAGDKHDIELWCQILVAIVRRNE